MEGRVRGHVKNTHGLPAVNTNAAHAGKEKAEQDPLGINWVDNFVTRHHDKIAGALRQLRLLITAHQCSGL